jgi:23S rRNA pseudouridine2605 synthase
MRLNQYLAHATGLSRRTADQAIGDGRVTVNGRVAQMGQQVSEGDRVALDGRPITAAAHQTVLFHKPVGYITSRRQQGATPTIYQLLPDELQRLKPVGRLDKDSSGLLLLTSDGNLSHGLMHPSSGKWKVYDVELDRKLAPADLQRLKDGVDLEDGVSHMHVSARDSSYEVRLQEGRNRQIRRSFAAAGYTVTKLHRHGFGDYELGGLGVGEWRILDTKELS